MQGPLLFLFGPPLTPTDLAVCVIEHVVDGFVNTLASDLCSNYAAAQLEKEMNDAPSPVIFKNNPYCFYNSGTTLCCQYIDSGGTWVAATGLPNITDCQSAPSAVVFNDLLYVFFPQSSSNIINFITSSDGTTWSGVNGTDGAATSAGNHPSAVVFGDPATLNVFITGGDGYSLYCISSPNGTDWSTTLIPNTGSAGGTGTNVTNITNSPSAIVLPSTNCLYVFHQGPTSGSTFNSSDLCYNMMDTAGNWQGDRQVSLTAPTDYLVEISATPSAFVYNDQIIVIFDDGAQLYNVTSTDGSQYTPPAVMGQLAAKNGVSVTTFNGQLVMTGLVPSAGDNGGVVGCAATTPGGSWGFMGPVLLPFAPMLPLYMGNSVPALIEFNSTLYCFTYEVNETGALCYNTTTDGITWSTGAALSDGDSILGWSPSPMGPVVFNNDLYVFYQGGGWTYYSCLSDGSWSGNINVPNSGASFYPSPVVYEDSIYYFHTAKDNGNAIWFNRSTGGSGAGLTWQGDQEIPGFNDNSVSFSSYNGTLPPVAVIFNGSLYLFYVANAWTIAYRQYLGSNGSNGSGDWSAPGIVSNPYNTFGAGAGPIQYYTTENSFNVVTYTDSNNTPTLAVYFLGYGGNSIWYATTTNLVCTTEIAYWSSLTQAGVQRSTVSSAIPGYVSDTADAANWVVAPFFGKPGEWWEVFAS